MNDDSELLKKQLKVNDHRLRKLEKHKISVELQLKNPRSKNDSDFLLEVMKRLDHNLQLERKQREGILNAINSEIDFK